MGLSRRLSRRRYVALCVTLSFVIVTVSKWTHSSSAPKYGKGTKKRTSMCDSDGACSFVMDVGMNTGQDTMAYLQQGLRVLSVEANPILVEQFSKDTTVQQYISNGTLKILGVGISETHRSWTTVPFYINSFNDVFSSFDSELGCRSANWHQAQLSTAESCTVQHIFTISCSDIISIFGVPVYLKIDIEGRDVDCIRSLIGYPHLLPRYISIEGLPNAEFAQIFRALGYKKFKVVDQSQYLQGASGPFGEESIDVHKYKIWSSWEELAARTYVTMLNGTIIKWYDIHAGL